jgi:sigma-70-like protein
LPPPTTLCSAIGSVALDVDLAERICLGILNGTKGRPAQYKHLFGSFPEINRDDAKQEAMLAICRQWCSYDPSKSQPQTFMYQRAQSALIDLARRCASGKGRVKRAAEQMREKDFWHNDPDLADTDRPLDEMLAENLAIARKLFSKRRYRSGRRAFSMPQLVAIAMLMRQKKIRSIRCRQTLLARPELLLALKLKSVPSDRWLRDARARLERYEQEISPKKEKAEECATGLPPRDFEAPGRPPEKPEDLRPGLPPHRKFSGFPGHPLDAFSFCFPLRTTRVA